MYSKQLYVSWSDLDANGHMRNTAYLDRVADVVMSFFTDHGFPVGEFARLGLGPVVQTEQIEYRRAPRAVGFARLPGRTETGRDQPARRRAG